MSTPIGPRGRLLAASGVALVAGIQLLPWAIWSTEELAAHGLFRDDGFFYAVLAGNFSDLGFLTFDGVLPTNGVQPLWMAILLVVKALFPGVDAPLALARMSFATYVAFAFTAALWACRGPALRALVCTSALSALVLSNPAFQHFAVRGLETPLLLLLLVLLLLQLDRLAARDPVPIAGAVGLALLGVLCFFARTHLFWLSVMGFAWLAWRKPRSPGPLVAYAAVTAAAVLPYLAFNAIAFGSAMPISGRVKRYYLELVHPGLWSYLDSEEWYGVFSAFAESIWIGWKPAMWLWAIAVGLVLTPLLVIAIRQLRAEGDARWMPPSLGVLALASSANLILMYGWYRELRPYTSYYFASEVFLVAAICAWWLRRASTPRGVLVGCGVLLLVTSAGRLASLGESDYWSAHLAVIEDVEALPPDASVGAYWPGALGALSGRSILPLDGIIGSPEYFDERVRTGRDLDWLLERDRPTLAIYLHRSPEALLAGSDPPEISSWNELGEVRLWSRRDCGPRVLGRHPRPDGDKGWYLFGFDPVALARCREAHGIGRGGVSPST